jgi:transposase InsO family protein
LDQKDLQIKQDIEQLHLVHPAYGHRRLAVGLKYSPNRILRIMHKFGIKPPRRRIKRHYLTKLASNHSYTNLIKNLVPSVPSQILASDLTYLEYQGKFVYLATVVDIFTREIISAEISQKHDSHLALSVIENAIENIKIKTQNNNQSPPIFHSDQGTEFMAQIVTNFLKQNNIQISVSDKGSPWQNPYQESLFDKFKNDIGDINRFETLGELIAEIYAYVHYYNNLRIHTSLKMPPVLFRQKFSESVSEIMGT